FAFVISAFAFVISATAFAISAFAFVISATAFAISAMPTVVTERLVSGVEPCRSAGYAYAFADCVYPKTT
ncbi:hypothetical protein LC586_12545, partial [Nostoc sp. CHAB 5714]|nr:hypothetical protein [Nostoc favosum CHAB5714]